MEKRVAHHPLTTVHAYCAEGSYRLTKSAASTAVTLSLNRQKIIRVLLDLTVKDFYKSMTSYNDPTQWQDVYHPSIGEKKLYVKLIVQDGLLILSFKEL